MGRIAATLAVMGMTALTALPIGAGVSTGAATMEVDGESPSGVSASSAMAHIDPLGAGPAPAHATAMNLAEQTRRVAGIHGGDASTIGIVEEALDDFRTLGLLLPPLAIHVHASKAPCRGNNGLYNGDGSIERIDLCHPARFVVLHELAHAWEANNVSNGQREAFLEATGLEAWTGADIAWQDRGIERAANVLAQAIRGRDGAACGQGRWDLVGLLTRLTCRGAAQGPA